MFKETTNTKSPSTKLSTKLSECSLTTKTPNKIGRSSAANRSQQQLSTKSPSVKLLKQRSLTPSRNVNFFGGNTTGGDRFIPTRSDNQYELASFHMSSSMHQHNDSSQLNNTLISAPGSPSKIEYQRIIRDRLNGGVSNRSLSTSDVGSTSEDVRILAYRKGLAPQMSHGTQNHHKVLYTGSQSNVSNSCKKTLRHIPDSPERILDAPDFMDDFYLNVLDWGANNLIAVALRTAVYLWNASTGSIQQMVDLDSTTEYVSSVSWSHDANVLAVGYSNGNMELYDPSRSKLLRMLDGHGMHRVGALSWNQSILSSGSRSGMIVHSDVRLPHHKIQTLEGHSQEVCGLKWSLDGNYLASGANDNQLRIWSSPNNSNQPIHILVEHSAAVRAIAWCPWQSSMVASGGGTADRTIRLWNVNTGTCTMTTDTDSQVNCLLWNKEYHELISAHGYPNNNLAIWKYPQMNRLHELTGHTQRVLGMCSSPCTEFVMSASADESLRLWHCFKIDAVKKKERNARARASSASSIIANMIR